HKSKAYRHPEVDETTYRIGNEYFIPNQRNKLPISIELESARPCDTIMEIVDRMTKYSHFIPTEEATTTGEIA
ncbi:hypothetical protein K505DRAFT_258042, partial [Melanomma pulvis-pyrius CBS 109.77]